MLGSEMYDDGIRITKSVPYLADVNGRWKVQIEGVPEGGLPPYVSRTGYMMAFRDLSLRTIQVGQLRIED